MALPTLVVIAKNESRCIERCLLSAQPFVGHILLLDTGSSDRTPEIARACGAEVHFFTWVDDFSVARNRALDLADADWNLILDADEWVEPEAMVDWTTVLSRPRLGLVQMLSAEQSTGRELIASSSIPRLLPRGVRYEGRIHEQPMFSGERIHTGLRIGHDGYMKAQLETKRGRNLHLLRMALGESPDDPYLLYQLGREYEGEKHFETAYRLYRQSLLLGDPCVRYAHSLVVRAIYCCSQSGLFDQALRLIDDFRHTYAASPDFHFAAGNAFLDKAINDPTNALEIWLPKAIGEWERCLEIGDRPDLEGSVQGRGSFLAESNLRVVTELIQGTRPDQASPS